MISLRIVIVCCVALVMGVSAKSASIQKIQEVIMVRNVTDYLKNNANIQLIQLNKELPTTRDDTIRYSIGNRINGDRLVAKGDNGYYFPTLMDVELTITYPEYGQGSIVTYVHIIVQQSNQLGNAYVVEGGIGYRNIKIVIEAKQTYFVTYDAYFYGYN